MLEKKKGFTIIELLGVIVVISIIATITTPLVMEYIETSRKHALLETTMNIVKAVDLKHYASNDEQIYTIVDGVINPSLNLSGIVNGKGYIIIDENHNIEIELSDKGYCAKKQFSDTNVQLLETECENIYAKAENLDKSGASIPLLDDSMVAVRYNGTSWEKADKDNADIQHQWYDYDAKMWANMAVIKKNERNKYINAELGTVIDDEDVVGYFVGIPSFSYSITDGDGVRSFDVKFTNQDDKHVAFKWGEESITGFWFGKFEASGSLEEINVLPNKAVLKNTSLTKAYQAVSELNNLKKATLSDIKISEIHLIKNTEWGAVAILSQSKYGICDDSKCDKVQKNETWNTGYQDKNSKYDSAKGVTASTTGNIYGIYDMNGATWEFAMGTNKVSSLGSSIEKTHYNNYTSSIGIKGDLTTEDGTANWYDNTAQFLDYRNWFIRGGDVNTANASIFWYSSDSASGGYRNGFRLAYILKKV